MRRRYPEIFTKRQIFVVFYMQIAILQKVAAWQDSILLPSGRLQQIFASLNIQWQTAS